jgi:hypothetical protein
MDDHDLGALLDASVPAPAASDETLSRIQGRATQRRRRTALAASALTVAMAVVVALGVSGLSSNGSSAPPAAPPARCALGDVSMRIDPRSASHNQVTKWAVKAESRAAHTCRLDTPITATVLDAAGQIVTTVRGASNAEVVPTDNGYVSDLKPNTPTLVAQLHWTHPCSDGPVDLEVAGISSVPARLRLPRQPCEGAISQSRLMMYAGEQEGTCPFGSLTIAIDPRAAEAAGGTMWVVTVRASHVKVACRLHDGFIATIETPGGTVLREVAGNPAGQGGYYHDVFTPKRPLIIGALIWINPCSDGPVDIVVRSKDASYGNPARRSLPRQPCRTGPVTTSRFRFELNLPTLTGRAVGTTTTAK